MPELMFQEKKEEQNIHPSFSNTLTTFNRYTSFYEKNPDKLNPLTQYDIIAFNDLLKHFSSLAENGQIDPQKADKFLRALLLYQMGDNQVFISNQGFIYRFKEEIKFLIQNFASSTIDENSLLMLFNETMDMARKLWGLSCNFNNDPERQKQINKDISGFLKNAADTILSPRNLNKIVKNHTMYGTTYGEINVSDPRIRFQNYLGGLSSTTGFSIFSTRTLFYTPTLFPTNIFSKANPLFNIIPNPFQDLNYSVDSIINFYENLPYIVSYLPFSLPSYYFFNYLYSTDASLYITNIKKDFNDLMNKYGELFSPDHLTISGAGQNQAGSLGASLENLDSRIRAIVNWTDDINRSASSTGISFQRVQTRILAVQDLLATYYNSKDILTGKSALELMLGGSSSYLPQELLYQITPYETLEQFLARYRVTSLPFSPANVNLDGISAFPYLFYNKDEFPGSLNYKFDSGIYIKVGKTWFHFTKYDIKDIEKFSPELAKSLSNLFGEIETSFAGLNLNAGIQSLTASSGQQDKKLVGTYLIFGGDNIAVGGVKDPKDNKAGAAVIKIPNGVLGIGVFELDEKLFSSYGRTFVKPEDVFNTSIIPKNLVGTAFLAGQTFGAYGLIDVSKNEQGNPKIDNAAYFIEMRNKNSYFSNSLYIDLVNKKALGNVRVGVDNFNIAVNLETSENVLSAGSAFLSFQISKDVTITLTGNFPAYLTYFNFNRAQLNPEQLSENFLEMRKAIEEKDYGRAQQLASSISFIISNYVNEFFWPVGGLFSKPLVGIQIHNKKSNETIYLDYTKDLNNNQSITLSYKNPDFALVLGGSIDSKSALGMFSFNNACLVLKKDPDAFNITIPTRIPIWGDLILGVIPTIGWNKITNQVDYGINGVLYNNNFFLGITYVNAQDFDSIAALFRYNISKNFSIAIQQTVDKIHEYTSHSTILELKVLDIKVSGKNMDGSVNAIYRDGLFYIRAKLSIFF
jgi:hypothetical protein